MTYEEKIDLIVEKVIHIDLRVEEMDGRLDNVEKRLDNVEKRLSSLEKDVSNLKKDVKFLKSLKEDVDNLKDDVSAVKLELENEVSRNIAIVAEGHSDIMRKFNETTKSTSAVEMLMVQVNILQSKVRDLENKISA